MSHKKLKDWINSLQAFLVKDLRSTKRVKKYLFPAIIHPLVLFIAISAFSLGGTPESYTVMLLDQDQSYYSQIMGNYIKNISSEFGPWFTVVPVSSSQEAETNLASFVYLGLIVIPSGFDANVTSGIPGMMGMLQLEVQNINEDYVKNYVQRLDEAILQFNQNEHVSAGHVDLFAINVQKSYLIGQPLSALRGFAIGAISLYGILCGLIFGSINIAKEYQDDTILEIINAPIHRTAFLTSKQIIGVIVGILITGGIGALFFSLTGLQIQGNIFAIILAFCLSTWTHAGIGIILGIYLKQVTPVLLISIFSAMIMWFFTGGFAPVQMLGGNIELASSFFPGTYWSQILFAETFAPNIGYEIPRFLILGVFAVSVTCIAWILMQKRGFKP
jgi:hypothetical protein